jgi:hypothetical protein
MDTQSRAPMSVFSKKTRAIDRRHVDLCLGDRIILFDPDETAETNLNRHMFAGSYRKKTLVMPGNHDVDLSAALR